MARLFSCRAPVPPLEKVRAEPGLTDLEEVANPDVYDLAYGDDPAQADGSSCAWAANSCAPVPVRAGEFSGSVAQQIGYRTPCLTGLETERRLFKWQFGAFSDGPTAADKFGGSAVRYARQNSVECGLARRSSRLTRSLPRASLFAKDYPCL